MIGLTLLIQTLLICIYIGISSNSFWFSYILFLIFIGGILILFIYIASLSSNEKIKVSFKYIIFWILFINLIFIISQFLIDNFFLIWTKNLEINIINDYYQLIDENFLILSKIYDIPNNKLTIIIIIYLLLTLIIIVKITNSFIGPLRTKN